MNPIHLPADDAVTVHREDGELLGLLAAEGDFWVPCTVFGFKLCGALPRQEAVDYLHAHGLACLADTWELSEGGEWLNVRIIEANPRSVTVSFADYGRADLSGERRTIGAPVVDALRRV